MTVTRGFPGAQVSRLTVAPRANQTTLQQKVVSAAIALPLLLVTPGVPLRSVLPVVVRWLLLALPICCSFFPLGFTNK